MGRDGIEKFQRIIADYHIIMSLPAKGSRTKFMHFKPKRKLHRGFNLKDKEEWLHKMYKS